MGIELRVSCIQGLTGLAFGEVVRVTEQGELQMPPGWTALRADGPGHGTAEIDGRKVRYESYFVDGNGAGRLELRGKIRPFEQRGIGTGEPGEIFVASSEMCFPDSGSGDQVVGTWIAEGGG